MRSIFTVVALTIAFAGPAGATAAHRGRTDHHLTVRHHGGETSFVPGAAYVRSGQSMQYDDTPRFDDPSRFGGQPLGAEP
ncbi:hypothetical protein SAMN05444164_7060 [Bradyrhizobium erythrophlei]|uniref:Uncharacterized protein n=1 Tax=Bradyrhizobium erythrophlei TaxID=1437360 RepID=A0A1H5GEG6_9BRAD|nr:hypothetical protein SAMN05444164_7060 [Bradyrhizobium erythrophlei]